MQKDSLVEKVSRLRSQPPLEGATYFAITLLATKDGQIQRSCQSQFVGWDDFKLRREIREACPVDPVKALDLFESIHEPGVLVNSQADLFLYLLIGGHGIIEEHLCKKHFADLVAPRVTVRSVVEGFVNTESAPQEWFRRAPTRKARMRVLKRDGLQCRLCGRSPNDYVDIELHLHHVVPWGEGGLTEEDNLITICDTCHSGLEPHFDPELFSRVGFNPFLPRLSTSEEYRGSVTNYRHITTQLLKKHKLTTE